MEKIRQQQENFYGDLFNKHKGDAFAVASESFVHKRLRFEKISEIFADDNNFSIHDVGMGMGHYYEYLKSEHSNKRIIYSGSEITKEYYDYCCLNFPKQSFFYRDLVNEAVNERYDYVVLSGVFHQIRNNKRSDWETFMRLLLKKCFGIANKGIVFNCLTDRVDYFKENNFYCNLNKLQDFIVEELSRYYNITQSYPIFEATIFVFTKNYVKSKYQNPELQKYML